MTLPPGYLLACLLLWSWQSGHWWLGLGLGLWLELARGGWLGETAMPSGPRLCTLISGIGTLLVVSANVRDVPVLRVLEWLPMLAAPWLLWQYRRFPGGLPASWWGGGEQARVPLDLGYAMGCLLAASLGNRWPTVFAPSLLLLTAWLVCYHRPRGRWGWPSVLLVLALAGTMGSGLHRALMDGQTLVESHLLAWISQWWQPPYRDPNRQTTALGQIGRLKQSSRIVIRLEQPSPRPRLLMQATYNVLVDSTWFARLSEFHPLPRQGSLGWRLQAEARSDPQRLTIIQDHAGEQALLALPIAARRVWEMPAETLQANQYGAVRAIGIPSPVRFRVEVAQASAAGSAPAREDRWVPEIFRPVLDELIVEAGLAGLIPARIPAALERFFKAQFRYSLVLEKGHGDQAVVSFLRTRRQGHCEYFATATVLLLRRLGIPARYATGYSVQEYSALEGRMLARQRHAHAWALAHIGGRWQVVDTTPPDWAAREAALAPWWSGLADLWSWLRWELGQVPRWQLDQRLGSPLLLGLVLLLGALRLRQRQRRWRPSTPPTPPLATTGMDSECYKIVNWCERQGLERPPGQTLAHWLPMAASGGDTPTDYLLSEILRLHYRYRFDPAGLGSVERRRLRELSERWLDQRQRRSTPSANKP